VASHGWWEVISPIIRRSAEASKLKLLLARARTAPDERDPAKAVIGASGFASTPVPSRIPASIAIAGTKVTPRPLSTIWTSVWSEVPIIAAWARNSGRLQAASVVLEAMAVLEQQHPILVDRIDIDRSSRRGLAAG
jgi:hypothetical protein